VQLVTTLPNAKAVITATRDDILLNRDRKVDGRYYFQADSDFALDLLSFTDGVGFAQSRRTNLLWYVTVTGKTRRKGGLVRAWAIPAEDTGDLAGTLAFDPDRAKVGGWVNADLFFWGPQ
jgi:hypothetical protein